MACYAVPSERARRARGPPDSVNSPLSPSDALRVRRSFPAEPGPSGRVRPRPAPAIGAHPAPPPAAAAAADVAPARAEQAGHRSGLETPHFPYGPVPKPFNQTPAGGLFSRREDALV